jgi:hypothetical protein
VTRAASTFALALALAWVGPPAHAQESHGEVNRSRPRASADSDGPIPQLVKFIGNILPTSPDAGERAVRAPRAVAPREPRAVVLREPGVRREPRIDVPQRVAPAQLPPRRPHVPEQGVLAASVQSEQVAEGQRHERGLEAAPSEGLGVFAKLLPFRLGEDIEQRLEVAIAEGPLPPRRPGGLVVAMAPSGPELTAREDAPRQDLNLFARVLPEEPQAEALLVPRGPLPPRRPLNERVAAVPRYPQGSPKDEAPPRTPPDQKVAAVSREDAGPRDDDASPRRVFDPFAALLAPNLGAQSPDAAAQPPLQPSREPRQARLLPSEVAMMAQRNAYAALIAKHANEHGVPLQLAHAVVRIESGYNPRARNGPNHGLTQINYETARSLGYGGSVEALYEPDTNLRYGMRYLGMAYRLANGDTCGTVLKYQGGHQAQYMTSAASSYCAKARAIIASAR